jgi:hypothetical protein
MSDLPLGTHLSLADLPATRPLLALWGGLAVLDVGRLVGAAPTVQVAFMAVVVAACSYGAGHILAVAVAGIGWLLLNGFVAHGWGQLGFTGGGDVVRAAVLLVVAQGVAELGR